MDITLLLIFAGVIVVGLILIMVITTGRGGTKQFNKEAYQKDWLSIEMSVSNDPASQQFAILQADKLLDRALRERGYRGETMGERMTVASRMFTRRDAVWAAHKLRNRIAHDDKVMINAGLTKKALASFKKALKDLGAI